MNINSKKPSFRSKSHLNHMNSPSYNIANPILQLRTIAASSFFGEPMYYEPKKDNVFSKNQNNNSSHLNNMLTPVINLENYNSLSPKTLMEAAILEALDFDVEATLKEAVRLRQEENIRTTPQVIMVMAANHKNARGTGLIRQYAPKILSRTDEAALQLAYQIQAFGKPIPNSLKKTWKTFLESRSEYQLAKYKMENRSFKTVDVVNLVHAKSNAIDLLMKGELKLNESSWESIISQQGSTKENWEKSIPVMGHMALLRNIMNFVKNDVSPDLYIPKLKETAKTGKQLPFRYFSAYKKLESIANPVILDAIEECLELAIIENLPHFKGKTMSLCDNSGSAHGVFSSKSGTVKVSEIANLMAILTGKASDEGYIGVFGDKLSVLPIRKKESVFSQMNKANKEGKIIGQGTEHGIWLFFEKAIKEKEHFDHIFVYSDMQAGHGRLYGNLGDYDDYIFPNTSHYIDVPKLINTYRKEVNSNVHVYLVQVAGYNDTIIPEFYDKTYILGGWSDKILQFANEMSKIN